MERVQSGLLIALKAIYENAKITNTDFNLLVEAIANDSIYSDLNEPFAKWLNKVFDFWMMSFLQCTRILVWMKTM